MKKYSQKFKGFFFASCVYLILIGSKEFISYVCTGRREIILEVVGEFKYFVPGNFAIWRMVQALPLCFVF
jgi:hypothetical protein